MVYTWIVISSCFLRTGFSLYHVLIVQGIAMTKCYSIYFKGQRLYLGEGSEKMPTIDLKKNRSESRQRGNRTQPGKGLRPAQLSRQAAWTTFPRKNCGLRVPTHNNFWPCGRQHLQVLLRQPPAQSLPPRPQIKPPRGDFTVVSTRRGAAFS